MWGRFVMSNPAGWETLLTHQLVLDSAGLLTSAGPLAPQLCPSERENQVFHLSLPPFHPALLPKHPSHKQFMFPVSLNIAAVYHTCPSLTRSATLYFCLAVLFHTSSLQIQHVQQVLSCSSLRAGWVFFLIISATYLCIVLKALVSPFSSINSLKALDGPFHLEPRMKHLIKSSALKNWV